MKRSDIPICMYCDEPILEHEPLAPMHAIAHWECGLRCVLGGVNHLRGLCTCCGGTLPPDPPGLTRRECATLAAIYWKSRSQPMG